ncbi:MAG TPA: phenylalanine--tRNA ligase subunit alpha [Patescibacteria group bacterium]|nr:phenylalanine--tRNA ligase subunit alpha [Patescibacteria group bacterium]
MKDEIINLKNQALGRITDASNLEDLEEIRIDFLGRNGQLNKFFKEIANLDENQKKEVGFVINESKRTVEEFINEKKAHFKESTKKIFDETIPGELPPIGHIHLVTQAINEISNVFEKIGFIRQRYPEVEWDWYGFGALNFPENHPARDDWETFFMDTNPDVKFGPMILTPHTSSGQIREMERTKPPIRMINIAKCYRRQLDNRHLTMFHQFEGLVVDENITLVNLKGTLDYFATAFFGEKRRTRLRPYHFQFTEPSFEVDITCGICNGKGCKFCKEGWLELGGAGMVHPNVLRAGGIDSKKYSGFAFGWGVERTFMMKENMNFDDIRTLYSSDVRVLQQF